MAEISGGITNLLWKLSVENSDLSDVVVRIFGQQTDKIIDRDQERKVLGPLNAAGFGAQVLFLPPRTCVPCLLQTQSSRLLLYILLMLLHEFRVDSGPYSVFNLATRETLSFRIRLRPKWLGIFLQVLATFDNGRIEEFLEMHPLKPEEMTGRDIAKRIAIRLKEFHDVDVGPAQGAQLFVTISNWYLACTTSICH